VDERHYRTRRRIAAHHWPDHAACLRSGDLSDADRRTASAPANGFFVFKDGYEYVLVLSVVSLALAVLGPGRFSLDNAFGNEITGWAGGGIALGVAIIATAGMLVTFWRPQPKKTPADEEPAGWSQQ
jgi:hypothetical protein